MRASDDLPGLSERAPQAAPAYPNRPIPRSRRMDRSNAQARLAVADVASRFGTWRTVLAQMSARAERTVDITNRAELLDRCKAIGAEIQAGRTDLILELADAPAKVAGHSRVVDIERAFDNLEAALHRVRDALQRHGE
jgi:hypothetical protein